MAYIAMKMNGIPFEMVWFEWISVKKGKVQKLLILESIIFVSYVEHSVLVIEKSLYLFGVKKFVSMQRENMEANPRSSTKQS